MTILDALLALHPYPLDPEAVRLRVLGRGMHPSADFSPDLATAKPFLLAKADVLMLLAYAPNVSQEGVSYSIVDSTLILTTHYIRKGSQGTDIRGRC